MYEKLHGFFREAKFSASIAISTVIYSSFAAFVKRGSVAGVVNVKHLHQFGGVRLEDMYNLELWRIVTAQLLHVEPRHMLLNVVLLLLVGAFIEKNLGSLRTAVIYLVGGGLGTVLSAAMVDAPWNVGTGASHATFAMASSALIVCIDKSAPSRRTGLAVAILIVGTGLLLDLLTAGYPKPGHAISFATGVLIAWLGRFRAVSRTRGSALPEG
jgi:membrane associated rhomboid family serine protease